MPAEAKGESTVLKVGHVSSLNISLCLTPKELQDSYLPLGTLLQLSPLKPTNDFVSRLTEYLRLKNESHKEELEKMEEALSQAEETKNNLKQAIGALGKTVEALEGAVAAASHILSTSLICSICFETSSQPTSLKCGHSFCRDCLQRWFLSKFEDKCANKGIKLTNSIFQYIYKPTSSANEAERNMVSFARLSNLVRPDYRCPSCRDPLLPSVRNSYSDFRLTSSLTTLNALIGYVPPETSERKQAGVDMIGFLNSRFFSRYSGGNRLSTYIMNVMDQAEYVVTVTKT